MADVVTQPDGKLLVAGEINNDDADFGAGHAIAVARYVPDGTPHPAFAGGAPAVARVPGAAFTAARQVLLAADGSITVRGSAEFTNSPADGLLLRFRPDGTPDTSVAPDGQSVLYDAIIDDLGLGGDGGGAFLTTAKAAPRASFATAAVAAPAPAAPAAGENRLFRIDTNGDGTVEVAQGPKQVGGTGATLREFRTDPVAPGASLASAPSVEAAGGKAYTFTVRYRDNDAIDPATIGDGDVTVGSGKFAQAAKLVPGSVRASGPAGGYEATYSVTPPGGAWDAADNGTYTITTNARQVADPSDNAVPPRAIGSFIVSAGQPPRGVLSGPTAVKAVASSATSIQLSWFDRSGGETGYAIERSLAPGKGWKVVRVVPSTAAQRTGRGTRTFLDTGLAPGTRYYYRLRAVNASAESVLSAVASAVTPASPGKRKRADEVLA